MNYIILRYLLLFLLYFSNSIAFCQDENYDSVFERLQELNSPESLGDTVLNKYNVETEDSLQGYKHDKDFAYMKYLDSLLRNTKGLNVDTSGADAGYKRNERSDNKVSKMPVFNIFDNPVVKIFLWFIAVVLIGFLIYKLFFRSNIFNRNRVYKKKELAEKEENVSDPSHYDELISQAVLNKNFRSAIRYGYLQTLFMLADKGLLQFAADKTNYQYVKELAGKPYQNEFAAITLNYEYVWYGNFEIAEDVYNRMAINYRLFQQKI